jgi:purine/pyrimidine-nucleoside phosphorylase
VARYTSRTLNFPNGEAKTLGIMQPDDYTVATGKKELMEIRSGDVEVRLPSEALWRCFSADEQFEVAADASFDIRALNLTDDCCAFVD